MNFKNQQSVASVISVDPYNRVYYKNVSNHLEEAVHLGYSKNQYVISYLGAKSFISSIISLSKNIPEDDIADVLENKVYEDLALDMAISYEIKYVESFLHVDEANRYFNVFVVDPLTLENDFKNSVEDIKYLDIIIPVPLLFKTLYTKEILYTAGVHCFIYLQDNDSFLTIYNEGEFIYSKSLKYTFAEIYRKFCEFVGEQIPYDSFTKLLSSEGLGVQNIEYQKYFMKLFSEVFLHVSDVLTYVKRAYEIEKIDHIYIGSDIGYIPGIDEYSQTYLAIKTDDFNFNSELSSNDTRINQLHALMQLYATVPSTSRYECNFTIYHRPPPFAKRESGKLILITAAALSFGLLYPIVNWSLSYAEDMRYNMLQSEYDSKLHPEKLAREATINLKEKQKSEADKIKKGEEAEYNSKKNTLIKIHEVKVDYPMKSKHLTSLTHDFNRFSVNLKKISYEENNDTQVFTFSLRSSSDKKITELLKHLTDTKTGTYKFSLERIEFDEQEKSYTSELKAELL
jgi:hypothetical protein